MKVAQHHKIFKTLPRLTTTTLSAVTGAILLITASAAQAASLSVAQTPLFVATKVKPNIMMIIDNSGSMDWETLEPSNNGAAWWNSTTNSFVGSDSGGSTPDDSGTLNFNQGGNFYYTNCHCSTPWYLYGYLFPNGSSSPDGTGTGNRIYPDSKGYGLAIAPVGPYAFFRSPDYNGMYYNPSQTYTHWVESYNGNTFANADPTAAISDPTISTSSTIDLTSDLQSSTKDWGFWMEPGMVIPAGTVYYNGTSWVTASADITIGSSSSYPAGTYDISYYPATYYLRTTTGTFTDTSTGNPSSGTIVTCSDASNPANYNAYATDPGSWVSSTTSGVDDVAALGPDGSCLKEYQIKSGNTFPDGRSYAEEIQNFANWFVYYRKRHLALRNGAGKAFDQLSNLNVGGFPIVPTSGNSLSLQGMWDFDTQKSSFYNFLYGIGGDYAGTPLREALKYAGDQYNTNTNVITAACQQNFALLFTDGYAYATNTGVGNVDYNDRKNSLNDFSGNLGPYPDSYSNTMADIAMQYYIGPLRSDLTPGKVPVPISCSAASHSMQTDCNTDLHMDTYAITLGATGTLWGTSTYQSVADAYTTTPNWPDPSVSGSPVQVDDLYHAAVNGRGEMMTATNATDLATKLSAALSSIMSHKVSSASSIATNSTRLDTNTLIYQAKYDPSDWSGHLLAYSLNATTGAVSTYQWDAATEIPVAANRNIVTVADTNATGANTTGEDFLWSDLTSTQQSALDSTSAAASASSSPILDYIRGDQSKEKQNSGSYRNRSSLLGDIVNSDPWFVGQQNFGYNVLPGTEGSSYVDFLASSTFKNRTPMVYVGANDGMLHAFNANTGVEMFDYIPNNVIPNLSLLTDPSYSHHYYVDGSPKAGPAYFGLGSNAPTWHTVLVSGTGAGGDAVFALDVTDPDHFSKSDVLWEYTDSDLGTDMGQPSVVRLADGNWGAIFANGYNSANQHAVLYILNVATGAVIRKFDVGDGNTANSTCSTPNGLATPLAVDTNGDGIADTVYAGDMCGDLWKFDISDTDDTKWAVANSTGSGSKAAIAPMFIARGPSGNVQPITEKPQAGYAPNGDMMVYFGTGSYFQTGDNVVPSSPDVESFYGIIDHETTTPITVTDRSTLGQQQILAETTVSGNNYRVTSTNSAGADGWYMDLESPDGSGGYTAEGERSVSAPLLWADRVIFTTLIPSSDPCGWGGTSWMMELDPSTGAQLKFSPFDLNNDGVFNSNDYVTVTLSDGTTETVPASGIQSSQGIIKTPGVVSADKTAYKYTSGSSGVISVTANKGGPGGGRQSWIQLQ